LVGYGLCSGTKWHRRIMFHCIKRTVQHGLYINIPLYPLRLCLRYLVLSLSRPDKGCTNCVGSPFGELSKRYKQHEQTLVGGSAAPETLAKWSSISVLPQVDGVAATGISPEQGINFLCPARSSTTGPYHSTARDNLVRKGTPDMARFCQHE